MGNQLNMWGVCVGGWMLSLTLPYSCANAVVAVWAQAEFIYS